jgi:hypothetical protein
MSLLTEQYGVQLQTSQVAAVSILTKIGIAGEQNLFAILLSYRSTSTLFVPTVRARPGRLSALRVYHSKPFLHGTCVWARRPLNSQKRRFPARAVRPCSRWPVPRTSA